MKISIKTITRLFLGYFLFAIAIVVMINANIGLPPWDVFHQGLTKQISITMGQASIISGCIIVILDAVLGENVGWGTVGNMLFIGIFIDLIILAGIIPISSNIYIGIIMMIVGIILCGIATVLYLGAGLGSGPRDGLMVALHKKTNKSIGSIRTFLEVSVLVIGWLLGGSVGLGTVISAIGLGYVLQIIFKICNFDTKNINHRFIIDDIRGLKDKRKNKQESILENAIEQVDEDRI